MENQMERILYKIEGGLTKSELEVIKKAFDLFDVDHTGKADIKEIKETLINCGYDQKNPVLFEVLAEMDTPEAQENGGITFLDLMEHLSVKLFDKKSKEALQNLYSMFVDDSNSIRKETLKEICESIGKEYDDQTLQETLEKLVKYGNDITYEEFESTILKKKIKNILL